ncbi:hypothetical protein LVY72_08045 [Arthrobacter sp. I2-34]|uniref:Uncharacterized protein n=1 Tax=Arthrobacter hankyongi TaxID=2904801 RepID=A0ABS9L5L1_9MICC|nr:hypothetical protein [Arthrobacter hankyongi]MCG2621868.1 hypothetical protein [Arthrobacter hankyongi]
MDDEHNPKGRIGFWLTFLGPVAFGLMGGLARLFLPWLSSHGADVSAAERFTTPVLSGLAAAVVLQTGRWWLQARVPGRQREAVMTLGAVTLLVAAFAAGLAALLNAGALLLFLPLLGFIGFLRWAPRRKTVQPRDKYFGIYCVCILSFIVSAGAVSMSLSAPA